MTPEALEKLVKRGTVAELARAVSGLTEQERRSLSKTGETLYRQITRGDITVISRDRTNPYAKASLVALAVCPLSMVKRINLWNVWQEEEALCRILIDRRPDWADEWINLRLDGVQDVLTWPIVETLIRVGVCRKPTSDGYIRLMAFYFGYWAPNRAGNTPLSVRLRARPEILGEDVWRLFEVETQAFGTDWYDSPKHRAEGYESWTDALVKLAASGELSRDRLLDASLSAMWIFTGAKTLSGYRRFHEALKPTAEEITARQKAYRDLLGHKTSHIVGFALKLLKRLVKDPRLDGAGVLEAMPVVFQLEPKSQPCAALRLAWTVWQRGGASGAALEAVVAAALRHPAREVQALALEALEALVAAGHPLAIDRSGIAPYLSEVLRPRLAAFGGDAEGPIIAPAPEPEIDNDDAERLWADLREIDAGVRASLGLAADRIEDLTSRLPGDPVWRLEERAALEPLEPLAPIGSLDELIDAVAHAVEAVDSADDVERIIDAVCRLCDQRPADFAARTAPVLHRIETGGSAEGSQGIDCFGTLPALTDLIRTWLTGTLCTTQTADWLRIRGAPRFAQLRVAALRGRVLRQEPFQPLSTPTHRWGWIDPRVLVERLRSMPGEGMRPIHADAIQALLRLAPCHREPALKDAREIGDPIGRPVRWALGGDAGPTRDDRPDAPLWVAAARARHPSAAIFEALAPLELPRDWPDVVTGAAFTWTPLAVRSSASEKPLIRIERTPAFPSETAKGGVLRRIRGAFGSKQDPEVINDERCPELNHYPTALVHEVPDEWWHSPGIQTPWLIHWTAMVWPLNPRPFFIQGIEALARRVDKNGSSLEPIYAYLHPLFERCLPVDETAALLLWLGLLSKDADVRQLALDVAVEGIGDGRISAGRIAAVLSRLVAGGRIKLNRLGHVARELSRVSGPHQLVAAEVIEACLMSVDPAARGLHELLEPLHEIQHALGRPLSPAARERLASIKGKGKTAKLARALIEDAPERPGALYRQALLEVWRSRAPDRRVDRIH